MSYNWIDAKEYTMDCCLLFDRWVLRWIFTECSYYKGDYITDMAKALYRYPYLDAFCRAKAPECSNFLDKVRAISHDGWTDAEMREAETAILQAQETFVVYAYPRVMDHNTFDVVLSGHVVGDFYDAEIAEMTRITKNGGWLVICNGNDEFKRSAPNDELVSRGFEWFCHESPIGGIIYDYRKQIIKQH